MIRRMRMHEWEDTERIEQIIRLINRKILGSITQEEEAVLEAWRQADPRNDALYRQLLDRKALGRGYRQWKAVDVNRPLEEMNMQIKRLYPMPFYRRMWFHYVVAAVWIGVVGGLFWVLQTRNVSVPSYDTRSAQTADSLISHGSTRALLTLANGDEVPLGADEVRNEKMVREQKEKARRQAKMNDLSTPRGGEFKIELEDGTQVWLNAESRLHYPDTFSTGERRVQVEGEAYFKVARNEQKPFYVETAGQLVKVYGTEFNICAYREENEVRTTLISGSIALKPLDGSEAELVLTPGHQAVFDKTSELTSVRTVDTDVVTGWRKGVFVFENQTLEQILRSLSRWYDFDYRFEKEESRSLVFMGSVPRYGSFSEVLNILEKSSGVHFRMNGRTVIVG